MYFNEQQECKTRPQVINVNGDEPAFFPFNIKTSKFSGSCNLGLMFVIMNKVGIKINADVNAKNYLIKECVIKDLFGILVIVNVNVIKRVMLVNI